MTSFQKCKLSFNILAYLENYLQEPSADELLHPLFPPLAFLVDECYDLFGEDLVRDILSPLLTGAAVAMLGRHLGNKESSRVAKYPIFSDLEVNFSVFYDQVFDQLGDLEILDQ